MNRPIGSAQETAVTTRNSVWRVSSGSGPKLRVGVLQGDMHLEKCFVAALQDIQASNFAHLDLLILTKNSSIEDAAITTSAHAGATVQHALYNLYLHFDGRLKPGNHPLDKIDCSAMLAGSEIMRLTCDTNGQIPKETLAQIAGKELDVLINFDNSPPAEQLFTSARFGIWSYQHSDPEFYRGGPAHFWELYENSPVSGVVLEARSQTDAEPLILCKSIFSTQKTLSVSANRFAPYWGASELIIRKLNELHRLGWDHITRHCLPPPEYRGKRLPYDIPSNRDMARWLGPALLKKALSYPFRKARVQHWDLGIRTGADPLFADGSGQSLEGFQWIKSPPGYFWADPFGFECEGKTWIFFEEYSYQAKRAWIACAEIRDGVLGTPIRCLENPQRHYSYPYIFQDGPEIFMIPEAYDSASVDLYRCQTFPDKWVLARQLLRGQFVDTSVWKSDDLWWMMTTSADPNPRTACLFLFYSDSLFGPWRFHPANPISTDVRNNRGAGRVFRAGEQWIRPSQSCAPTYGYSFSLNQIVALSPEKYRERTLLTVKPEFWANLCGVHTYNFVRDVELIDGAAMLPAHKIE